MATSFLPLELNCRFSSPAPLPAFKGSSLRGAFGHALKSVTCALRRQDCASCLLAKSCAYNLIFATEKLANSRLSARPHPYILNPPASSQQDWQSGEEFRFGLTLLGPAARFLPHILYAVEEMGRTGLGREAREGAGRFVLAELRLCGEERPLYTETDRTLQQPPELPWLRVEPPGRTLAELGLELQTPLRLKDQNSLQNSLNFTALIRAALRRVSALEEHYGEGKPELDYRGLLVLADKVETVQAELRWQEHRRYSNRQRREMLLGGMVGKLRFRGELTPFLPLLRYAEAVNLGKQTVFGLGKIHLLEVN